MRWQDLRAENGNTKDRLACLRGRSRRQCVWNHRAGFRGEIVDRKTARESLASCMDYECLNENLRKSVMKIGIIGTGNMGRALGLRWARAGHEVLFGSRDLNKAGAIAANGSGSAQAGDFDAAAAFGDVILYTIRDSFPSSVLKERQALAGKIV